MVDAKKDCTQIFIRVYQGPWNSAKITRLESSANGFTSLALTMSFLLYAVLIVATTFDRLSLKPVYPIYHFICLIVSIV